MLKQDLELLLESMTLSLHTLKCRLCECDQEASVQFASTDIVRDYGSVQR